MDTKEMVECVCGRWFAHDRKSGDVAVCPDCGRSYAKKADGQYYAWLLSGGTETLAREKTMEEKAEAGKRSNAAPQETEAKPHKSEARREKEVYEHARMAEDTGKAAAGIGCCLGMSLLEIVFIGISIGIGLFFASCAWAGCRAIFSQ